MAFPVPLTSVLSGATRAQLAYWRRPTASHPPLLIPAAKHGGRFLYSWADVVALRSIVFLRQDESLFRIRRAVQTLVRLEEDEWEHLSQYRLVRTPRTIVVQRPDGRLMDVGERPGTMLEEVLMADVLGKFTTDLGRRVPSLANPRETLSVDPGVLGGYPVVRGSRVPYDLVASLADEGMVSAEIVQLYPTVRPEGVEDARAFAEEVAAAA